MTRHSAGAPRLAADAGGAADAGRSRRRHRLQAPPTIRQSRRGDGGERGDRHARRRDRRPRFAASLVVDLSCRRAGCDAQASRASSQRPCRTRARRPPIRPARVAWIRPLGRDGEGGRARPWADRLALPRPPLPRPRPLLQPRSCCKTACSSKCGPAARRRGARPAAAWRRRRAMMRMRRWADCEPQSTARSASRSWRTEGRGPQSRRATCAKHGGLPFLSG